MADPAADAGGGRLNLTALGVGAAGLTAVIAGLSTTGTMGRVIRNDPDALAIALVLVIAGAAAFAAAGLPLTHGFGEVVFSVLGLELTLAGLVIGAITGVRTAGEHPEQPTITASFPSAGMHLTGTAKAGDLTVDRRVVVLVEGLRVTSNGERYQPTTLLQTYAGPDGEGSVSVALDLHVPAGRFDAVGINSWTEHVPTPGGKEDDAAATNDRSCNYDRRVSAAPSERAKTKIGCLVLPVSPVPRRPRLVLSWPGEGPASDRVEVRVAARNSPVPLFAAEIACSALDLKVEGKKEPRCQQRHERGAGVALVVLGDPPRKGRVLYRTILQPNRDGYLNETIQVLLPPKVRIVCAAAKFVRDDGGYPSPLCPATTIRADRSVAEARRALPRAPAATAPGVTPSG